MAGSTQKVKATAELKFTKPNGTKVARKKFTWDFIATNLPSGTYPQTAITQAQEQVPLGIAQYLYESHRKLAAEGSLSTVEAELSSNLVVGKLLNIVTPNRPAWATLNALIQESEESAFDGVTSIAFGAPAHFTANDLQDICRQARMRRLESMFVARNTSLALASGRVQMPSRTPENSKDNPEAEHETLVVGPSVTPAAGKTAVLLGGDPAQPRPPTPPANVLDLRTEQWKGTDGIVHMGVPTEVRVQVNGSCDTHVAMVLMSEPYLRPSASTA
jgi:hypothetical protein